ncbi:hypothetical protein [Actinoplanes sp. GCM10030250]|uniref:hypothetical protein n=1 Tax=Actinoplanes sp. GCM10030250 TaxID=3273376 RepID=UPI00361AF2A7
MRVLASPAAVMRSYAEVLRLPGAARPLAGVALASVPIGALSLAMVLLVEASTGRYDLAGLVAGALALGTGAGILAQGRLMDRFGQTLVLNTAVMVQLPALCVVVFAVRGWGPAWLPVLLAFVAGACEPQVGGAVRALWPRLAPERLRGAAHAWTSVIFESAVLAGPLLLIPAMAVAGPAGGVLCCGLLFAAGGLLLASSGASRGWRPGSPAGAGPAGALASPGVRVLAVLAAMVGAVGGCVQFSAVTLAASFGMPSSATWLYAALSTGSLIGVVAGGARLGPGEPGRRLAVMAGGLAAAVIGCALAPGLAVLGVAMFCGGLLLGPLAAACFALVAAHIPAGTEAGGYTTLTAASLAAHATAVACAGLLTETAGEEAGLLVGAGIALAAVPLVLMSRALREHPGDLG